MDLFIDKYYENEVENKLNYHKILYGNSDDLNLTIEGIYQFSFRTGNSLIVVSESINSVKVINNGVYLQEFKIANNMKRFTLESL
jgi:hypothetical protein